jgi:CheY-like chemotaxis protein
MHSKWRYIVNTWLVVEDDHYGSELVASMLRYHQINADLAQTAEEAMQYLVGGKYTLAIIDLNLPGIDGWSLLQSIQANDQTASLPCVAITAYHDARVAHEAMEAGFAAYFPKPLPTSFVQEVERFVVG